MRRLRTLSIARVDALDRRNAKSAWGGCYWRGVNLRKQRERIGRRLLLMRIPGIEIVPVEPPADGESAVETAARMVH